MTITRRGRRGQALLLVTLALFAMCGLLGLAVDLGWSYYVKKTAQNAADSAALAAAYQMLADKGLTHIFGSGDLLAPGGADCNGVSGELVNGCDYANSNDFNPGGHGGRQKINMTDGLGPLTRLDGSSIPACSSTVSINCINYWVTVRTVETVPQLFSAVLGNLTGISSARATAAIAPEVVAGNLITLNRKNDKVDDPRLPRGVNIQMGGGDTITAPQGVTISSSSGSAATQNGKASINDSPITLMGPGQIDQNLVGPGSTLTTAIDGPQFDDPFQGKGQPPLTSNKLPTYAVIGGDLSQGGQIFQLNTNTNIYNPSQPINAGNQNPLPSGNYVPAVPFNCRANTCQANLGAGQLSIGNPVSFQDPAGFGYYFFYGGLNVGRTTMTMGAGEYVMVGSGPPGGSQSDINTDNKGFMDAMAGSQAQGGQVIILTGSGGAFTPTNGGSQASGPVNLYPGLLDQINSNPVMVSMALGGQLAFGPSALKSGADSASASVTGLSGSAPAALQSSFQGVVVWQDQANSSIAYTYPNEPSVPAPYSTNGASGYVDIWGCGTSSGLDNPCSNHLVNSKSPIMTFDANASGGFHGIVYQPRGAWMSTLGGPGTGIQGAVQIITGAIVMQGHGTISTTPPPIPLTKRVATLVE